MAEQLRIDRVSGMSFLRVKAWMPEVIAGARTIRLGSETLPSTVGATLAGASRVLCLGPAEWLVVSPNLEQLRERYEIEARAQGIALVDFDDALTGIVVAGPAARDVLSKNCGLDLHPGAFPPGRCARTRFAQIPVVIECLDDSPRFALYCGCSYFDYLHAVVADSA